MQKASLHTVVTNSGFPLGPQSPHKQRATTTLSHSLLQEIELMGRGPGTLVRQAGRHGRHRSLQRGPTAAGSLRGAHLTSSVLRHTYGKNTANSWASRDIPDIPALGS